MDFPLLNVLGFACYTTSTTSFLFIEPIRQQYAARHPLAPVPTVRFNDFAFAAHALILCIITYSQLWGRLWGFSDIKGKRASRATLGVCWGSIVGTLLIVLVIAIRNDPVADPQSWSAIDAVSICCERTHRVCADHYCYRSMQCPMSSYLSLVSSMYRKPGTTTRSNLQLDGQSNRSCSTLLVVS